MMDVELGRDPNMKHYGHKQLGFIGVGISQAGHIRSLRSLTFSH
jgi:hypothetical protein